MTASKFIGKITTLCHDIGNLYGFITPKSPIDNHHGNVSFFPSDLQDIAFDELSRENIVSFETCTITKANGQSKVVARNVSATISGTIVFIMNDEVPQIFWGRIQCDKNNFLEINNHVIFFSDNFLHPITIKEIKLNMRVEFTVQDYQAAINNIDKKARSIKIIEPQQEEVATPTSSQFVESVESIVQSSSKIEENTSIFNTQILSTGQKFNRVKEGFGIEVNVKDDGTKEIKTKTKNAFR